MGTEIRPYCHYCDEYTSENHTHENDGPLCQCGHYEADHHRSWFAVTKYTPNGGKLVEECEYYAYNEAGGMVYNESTMKWEDHCHRFKEVSYGDQEDPAD